MHDTAITASPFSYFKSCDTARPRIGQCAAIRAGLGGKSLVHFRVPGPCRNRLVFEHVTEGRPARIKNRLRHAGLGESCRVDVADRNDIKLPNNTPRELVVKIAPAIRNLCADRLDPSLFPGPLRNRERLFRATVDALCFDFFTSRERGEIFQPQVDSDAAHRRSRNAGVDWNVNYDVEKPVSARVTGKIGAVPDFPSRRGRLLNTRNVFPAKRKASP